MYVRPSGGPCGKVSSLLHQLLSTVSPRRVGVCAREKAYMFSILAFRT